MSINKVILIGRLGADPEIRYTLDGKPVASFRIATNEVIVKNGEKETITEWHRIVAFGRLAEICGEYLNKGTQVYIEGKLRTRKYEDRQGIVRYVTEIIANNMRILDNKKTQTSREVFEQPADLPQEDFIEKPKPSSQSKPSEEPEIIEDIALDEEDLPF